MEGSNLNLTKRASRWDTQHIMSTLWMKLFWGSSFARLITLSRLCELESHHYCSFFLRECTRATAHSWYLLWQVDAVRAMLFISPHWNASLEQSNRPFGMKEGITSFNVFLCISALNQPIPILRSSKLFSCWDPWCAINNFWGRGHVTGQSYSTPKGKIRPDLWMSKIVV